MNNQTSLEKIKAYHIIKNFLNTDQQSMVTQMLNLAQKDLKRIDGLNAELEFTLIAWLLEECREMTGFDEGISQLLKTPSSDLYVELNSGKKLFIEIKSTEEAYFKISKKVLNEKEIFAQKFGSELYFAIKIKGFWGLYSSKYLESKNRKITFEEDYQNSKLNSVLGNKTYYLPEKLKIIELFSKSKKNFDTSNEYGYLAEYKIFYNNTQVFFSDCGDKDYLTILSLEHLNSAMEKQIVEKISEDITKVETVLKESIAELYNFLLNPILHLIDDNGYQYDYNAFFRALISDETPAISKTNILKSIEILKKGGFPIVERVSQLI